MVKLSAPPSTVVPYNYRQYLLGMLYLLLNNTSPETGDKLHQDGYTDGVRRYKLYTHNLLPVKAAYRPDGMVSLNNQWEYWFSTADPLVLAIVEHAVSLLSTLQLDKITFKICKRMRMPLRQQCEKFRCAAPITIKNKQGTYLSPEQPEFNVAVVSALQNRYRVWMNKEPDNISFSFIKSRRRLIQYRSQQGKILAFGGELKLVSSPDVVQFAQLVGLGHKTSIGMGLIVA